MVAILILAGLVLALGIYSFVAVILPRRRAADARYRAETDKVIDDSLGTWVPEAMRRRDQRRGWGHWVNR